MVMAPFCRSSYSIGGGPAICGAARKRLPRGRREKPVEFGQALLLCQTPEKFISDYEVFEKRPADCTLAGQIIERHEKLFGQRPEVLVPASKM
jgi:hypothetical protein